MDRKVIEQVAKLDCAHPDLTTVLFLVLMPSLECLGSWQVRGAASARVPSSSLPHLQGTHMLETADRSSFVTVILQELPPVETQDQRCRKRKS